MLTDMGLTVLEAENGLQAIEMAERTESPIDLLLTDIVMPGMSGWALAETLSSLRPEMRVLYMSGYPDGVIAETRDRKTRNHDPSEAFYERGTNSAGGRSHDWCCRISERLQRRVEIPAKRKK